VLTALDIITELGLLALPLQLVWSLQMPWIKKSFLIIAFYLRLPVIGFSLCRNVYTLRLHQASSDAGLDSAIVTIWLEVQLTYALAASTLSALKAFTESFETGFGLGFTRGKSEAGSYVLSVMSGSGNGMNNTHSVDRSRPHDNKTSASASVTSPNVRAVKYENTTQHISPRPTSQRPISPLSRASSRQPLRLRPDLTSRTTATATANVSATSETGTASWHHGGGSPSISSYDGDRERSEPPLVIMRETELSVRTDLAPGYGGDGRRV
jgi:hypothetical protein